MILRDMGSNNFKVVEITEDETIFVQGNPGFISVQEDLLPYSISGYYIKQTDGTFLVDDVKELAEMKNQKMQETQDKFNDMMQFGTFTSSLGFECENRRGNNKDDKDNVASLIDLGQEPVYFKDHFNQFHSLTLANLRTLKQEMIKDGLSKYQWKWNKETEIMNAADIATLTAVVV